MNINHKVNLFTPKFSSKPIKVTIDGILYSSYSEAAKDKSVDINTIKHWCKSASFPNCFSDKIKKEQPKDGKPGLIKIVIDGVLYRSISEASRKLEIPRAEIKRKLKSEEFPNYKQI
ncbi:MAG: hypothetical protein JXR69_04530 [Candidatus Delongbacteria bacterium]|nr:hypothetical protein [Candidatus Delongbacteria bacterium]